MVPAREKAISAADSLLAGVDAAAGTNTAHATTEPRAGRRRITGATLRRAASHHNPEKAWVGAEIWPR